MKKIDMALWSVVIFFGIVMVLIISTSSGQVPGRIGILLTFPLVMIVVTLFAIFFGGYKRKNHGELK